MTMQGAHVAKISSDNRVGTEVKLVTAETWTPRRAFQDTKHTRHSEYWPKALPETISISRNCAGCGIDSKMDQARYCTHCGTRYETEQKPGYVYWRIIPSKQASFYADAYKAPYTRDKNVQATWVWSVDGKSKVKPEQSLENTSTSLSATVPNEPVETNPQSTVKAATKFFTSLNTESPIFFEPQIKGREKKNVLTQNVKPVQQDLVRDHHLTTHVYLSPRNPNFVGRDTELAFIKKTLSHVTQRVIVTGSAGVGKTQLMLEYAYRHRSKYSLVWYINCENEATFLNSYACLAQDLGIPLTEETKNEKEYLVGKIDGFLKNHSNWLLIYDAVQDRSLLPDLQSLEGHVLISSRFSYCDWDMMNLTLKEFEREDSIKLFLNVVNRDTEQRSINRMDQQDALVNSLVDELQDGPLSIVMAATFIREKESSMEQCLKMLKETFREMSSSFQETPRTCENSWLKLWNSILKAHVRSYPLVLPLLRFVSFLSCSEISITWLEKFFGQQIDSEDISTILRSTLSILARYAVIEMRRDGFVISSFVKNLINSQVELEDKEEAFAKALQVMTDTMDFFEKEEFKSLDQINNFMPHAVAFFEYLKSMHRVDFEKQYSFLNRLQMICQAVGNMHIASEVNEFCLTLTRHWIDKEPEVTQARKALATACNNAGIIFESLGDNRRALVFYQKAVSVWADINEEQCLDAIKSRNGIGSVLNMLGKPKEALQWLEKASEMIASSSKIDCWDLAVVHSNLGMAFQALGQFSQALNHYCAGLEIQIQLHGEKHSSVAMSRNNIGLTLHFCGKSQEGFASCQKALEVQFELYGESHPAVATSYNNLGLISNALGETRKSIECLFKALKIRKSFYGKNHPFVAISYNNLGDAFESFGDLQQGLHYHNKALNIFLPQYREAHPDVARSYNNIGSILYRLERFQESLKYATKALAIRQVLYEGDHPDLATSYSNVGLTLCMLGEVQKGHSLLSKSLQMNLCIYGQDHADVAASYTNLGRANELSGDRDQALENYRQALQIQRAIYGDKHPHVAISLNNIGSNLQDRNDKETAEAINYYDQALEIRKQLYGPMHPHVATILSNIGSAYYDLGDVEKALECYRQVLDIRIACHGRNHPLVAASYITIGAVLENNGYEAEARGHYQAAQAIFTHLDGEENVFRGQQRVV